MQLACGGFGQRVPIKDGAGVFVGGDAGFDVVLQGLGQRGVTGVAACGELVGVLGPSGSGKTTLLAMIAGSTEDLDASSALTGSVRMDGAELRSSSQRRKVRGGQCSLCCPCPRRCLHFLC